MDEQLDKKIDELLQNIDLDEPQAQTTSKGEAKSQTDDDEEFEKLLQEFISSEITEDDTTTMINDYKDSVEKKVTKAPTVNPGSKLAEEEKNLFDAYSNFTASAIKIAQKNQIELPSFKVSEDMLLPRYKPYLNKEFGYDTLLCWDILVKAYPSRVQNINPGASDEDLLNYAEKTPDEDLQMFIISYVETLIELEGCEIAYEKRRLKAKRKKIEKEIVEEHQRRIEKMKKYINAIEDKKFPVNAERLVNNYFKNAARDADGAYKVLTHNPATFAPIDVSKIKDRFFGLIKAKPEDGIRVNKELGNFLKNLKA